MKRNQATLFAAGDVNAFFGLMLDNVSGLVIMAGILTGVFGMPRDLVLSRMLPGSAVGVLLGDLLYSWLAWRLARRTGRSDVTAMPLGLDTPSTFGMAFGVIGPCFLATKDAHLTWQVGMATIVLMGVFKVAASFCGPALRRNIPRAGLLGSIAAVALLLIAYLPFLKLFASPVVGFLSLGIVFISLLARYRLPMGLPGALAGIVVGTVAYYLLGGAGLLPGGAPAPLAAPQLALYLPIPSLEFLGGIPRALGYLPLAIPFALATVVGGVDVTESAAVAGDDYNTRDILLVEGFATLVAGMCGGVMQSCPYIGHPDQDRRDRGLREQADQQREIAGDGGGADEKGGGDGVAGASPHVLVGVSFIPVIACLTTIEFGQMLGGLGKSAADLTGDLLATWQATTILGNGFIVTSLMWGAAFANVLDHRPGKAAVYLLLCSALSLCGIIHSPLASGAMFSPLAPPQPIVWHLAAGYAAMALSFWLLSLLGSASTAGE